MINNNFHVLRLFAAYLVFWGHSYVFLGPEEPIFLSIFKIGPLGVVIFFIISGYLIAASWNSDSNLLRYFIRRSLRIFPALIVFTIAAVFILGPLATNLSVREYFSNHLTFYYFSNIFLYINYYLPGVFEKARFVNVVNGSLWSLTIEFFMYTFLALLSFLVPSRLRKFIYLVLYIASILISIFWANKTDKMLVFYATDVRQIFLTGTYFWAGSVFYSFNLKRYSSLKGVFIAILFLFISQFIPHVIFQLAYILIPYIVLSFGSMPQIEVLSPLVNMGDVSYGFYIYSFPVQQIISILLPNIRLDLYLIICMIIALPISILSWRFVEKPCLRFKPNKPSI